MRREQKVEKRRRERLAIARARVQLAEKEREREREKVHVGFLLPFFFFSLGVVWLTFSLFFAQIWVHKLKLFSRVSRKERFLRDIKFKHFGRTKDIHHSNANWVVLERERENKKNRRDWYYIIAVVLKCRERANNNNNRGVPEWFWRTMSTGGGRKMTTRWGT